MVEKNYFRQLLKEKDSDAYLYIIGICVALPVLLVVIISGLIIDNNGYSLVKNCGFRRLTGLYCPGCGGTRAFYYLIHGRIIKSILYNPFTIYFTVITAVFYITQTVRFISKGRIRGMHLNKWIIIAGIIIIVLNFAIKNTALIFFHYQIIP